VKCGAALAASAHADSAPAARPLEEKAALVTAPPVDAHDAPRVEPTLGSVLLKGETTSRTHAEPLPEAARDSATAMPDVAVLRRTRDSASAKKMQPATSPADDDSVHVPPPRPSSFRNIWPVVVVAGVSLLAAGTFWMFTGPDADTKKAANTSKTTAKGTGAKPALAPRPADNLAATKGFSVKQAFEKLYGSYDPNLDGAFWTPKDAPKSLAAWNGRKLLIRPLVSKTFSEGDNLRHVIVTNSLDTKDGMVVKQGTGCRDCASLIGAAIFEKQRSEWKLISRHDFLTADGAFGAPPKVNVDFPSEGGIQLTFERSDLLDRGPDERSYSIVLRERKGVKSAMR
jgi:hypothetical protein